MAGDTLMLRHKQQIVNNLAVCTFIVLPDIEAVFKRIHQQSDLKTIGNSFAQIFAFQDDSPP